MVSTHPQRFFVRLKNSQIHKYKNIFIGFRSSPKLYFQQKHSVPSHSHIPQIYLLLQLKGILLLILAFKMETDLIGLKHLCKLFKKDKRTKQNSHANVWESTMYTAQLQILFPHQTSFSNSVIQTQTLKINKISIAHHGNLR